MTAAAIPVLVAEDSAFMRLALRRIIEAEGDLTVVAEVADGAAAVAAVARLRPAVVAMDLEMPVLDGLEATRRIMALPDPPAVVVVSHHTAHGSEAALRALAAGAVDYMPKAGGPGEIDLGGLDGALRGRLRHWAAARAAARAVEPPAAAPAAVAAGPPEVVVVGASTGGPDAMAALLAAAGVLPVPVVLAQHMPAGMATDLARYLARGGMPAAVAETGAVLRPGTVTVLPGGADGALARAAGGLTLRLTTDAVLVHPSVDLLFRSAALVARGAMGVVLTGMGRDGAAGAAAMAARGMPVLVQEAASCVVSGMPGSVHAPAASGDPSALGRYLAARLAGGAG